MTEITKDHAEWAVVDRWRKMLNTSDPDYSVSHAYAMFSSILCWVVQRVRTTNDQEADVLAKGVYITLGKQNVTSSPWCVDTVVFPGFSNCSAADFLRNLRDAVAHGDVRKICPKNENGNLVGFSFDCGAVGTIVLHESDLRRIADGLATLFCTALQSGYSGDLNFHHDAQTIVEVAA